MLNMVLQAVSGVAGQYMEGRKIKAQAKAEIETAKVKAQISQIERQASAEVDYDLEAMRQTQYSWKDEVALVVILAPFVGSFLPWTQDYVAQGWIHLNAHAPEWYSYMFMASIAASMGIRWAVSQFGGKK
tara:strand:+ start:796 stop:1185 length:390 start_codon:yes stop_codon:yes gene_type:complete